MATIPDPNPSKNLKELVVLEDARLIQLAGNRAFVAEFPLLNPVLNASNALKGCSRCQTREKRAALITVLNEAKTSLARMPAEKKRKLAEMLSARKVRVIYRDGTKTVELTFGA